jgi:hypothetical protein
MSTIAEQKHISAWVVFTGKTDICWLKILKSGFKHCFVLLNDGRRWVSIDPLSAFTDIQVYHHIEANFDLPEWLEGQGYIVQSASINKSHKRPAPWMVLTCVESVKRILGLHKRHIYTPWQLYRFLQKISQINNQFTKKEIYHG